TVTDTPTDTPTGTSTPGDTATDTPAATETPLPCNGAYHYLLPETESDPPNGGTVQTGRQFTLDMWINAAGYRLTVQQAYLTFTHQLLDNVAATSTSCVLTSTVTPDLTVFEAVLQNEVCNGPNPCTFRGQSVDPGSIAFASGVLTNPPHSGPDFIVAR